ncbi:MAG: ubiquinol-cytochrome C chaperone [Alphaproteobacteria bacterium]|nr:ubiquinol-cytochrome C chaperone [Alphaproteobacteria bacterium]
MLIWPFHRSRAETDAEALLSGVTAASRRPEFYGADRVPDTMDGRFELMATNGVLAMLRLRADPALKPLAQAFADRLFSYFDAGLREAGTGDTAVPKRMHKLAGDFYGRLDAYGSAIDDPKALEAALARNVWRLESHAFAPQLASYVAKSAAGQAHAPISAMFAAEGWPQL